MVGWVVVEQRRGLVGDWVDYILLLVPMGFHMYLPRLRVGVQEAGAGCRMVEREQSWRGVGLWEVCMY